MFGVYASAGLGVRPHISKRGSGSLLTVGILTVLLMCLGAIGAEPDDTTPRLATPPVSRIVAPAGDTNGPAHSFKMAQHEVTNAEFVRFLNSVQANSTNALGTNVFFDARGNAWINPVMKQGRDEMFSIAKSRIAYDRDKPVGQRFSVARLRPRFGGNYERHPASGISWFGAIKYCNWLTLATGRDAMQRCYREGINTLDWAPVTASVTNWTKGVFSGDERERWLRFDGYRLPMEASEEGKAGPGKYNEFFRAASWDGSTNRVYGFGRDQASQQDANIPATTERKVADTLPVGFFSGNDHAGRYATVSNQNFYGLDDITGNVEEWLNDFGREGSTKNRAAAGSSWRDARSVSASKKSLPPHATSDARGFRVGTSSLLEEDPSAAAAAWVDIDCDQYGGARALGSTLDNLDAYIGGGEIVLDMQRWQIEDTNDIPCDTDGETAVDTSELDETFQIRIGVQGAPSFFTETDMFDDTGALRPFVTDPRVWIPDIPIYQAMYYSDIYPGIDAGIYGDMSRWELVFVSRPGSDLADVQLLMSDLEGAQTDGSGNLVYQFGSGKMVFGSAIVHESSQTDDYGDYIFSEIYDVPHRGSGALLNIDIDPVLDNPDRQGYGGRTAQNPPEMALVSASGDTNGPAYDFYVSTFEITNEQLLEFLNSAQANTNNLLGTNMVFDSRGNVWLNEEQRIRRDAMFSLADSRLTYDPDMDIGERYEITGRQPTFSSSYTNHPATGISWYGAAKYCNWLTLMTGRGEDQLCYRESTNALEWAPSTSALTNWQNGVFTDQERGAWLDKDGFRMAMGPGHGSESTPGAFNEFTKAATWTGKTNSLYGYGRSDVQVGDANYNHEDITTLPDTFPVGFFDGSDHDGKYLTRTNENLYGIHDMSGNVDEWVTDVGLTNSALDRAFYGGSWQRTLPTVLSRRYGRAYDSSTTRGFRVVSTQGEDERAFVIRIPLYICVCGYFDPDILTPEDKEEEEEEEEPDDNVLTVDPEELGDSEGLLYTSAGEEEELDEDEDEDEDEDDEDDDIQDDGTVEASPIQP